MAVNYSAALKDTRMQAVVSAIDVNAAPAFIEIATVGFAAVIVTITLSKPSFSEVAAAITMLGVPKSGVASLAGTNVAAVARIKDGGGNVIVNNLTVGTSATDIVLNSVSISQNQTVTITSGVITHSP